MIEKKRPLHPDGQGQSVQWLLDVHEAEAGQRAGPDPLLVFANPSFQASLARHCRYAAGEEQGS